MDMDINDNPRTQNILNRIPSEWGKWISCGPGWHVIICDLDDQLAALDPEYTIAQVKEKFGGLRFYLNEFSGDSKVADKLIREAEFVAERTCEECGAPAFLMRRNHWFSTLCADCCERSELENPGRAKWERANLNYVVPKDAKP